jgi:hypothetical protein
MRLKIRQYLLKWRNILEERGNEELNSFVLKNGCVNPKFDEFCKSKDYIKKYTLSKEFRKKNVTIEITGEEDVERKFTSDIASFDREYSNIVGF